MYARGIIHGDPAARNLMVPYDKQSPPVWIDLSPTSRDIESTVTWKRQALIDSAVFGRDLFCDLVTCEPCLKQLDDWCIKHVSNYKTIYDQQFSAEYFANRDEKAHRVRLLVDFEEELRLALLEPFIDTGFTLEGKPPSHLLVMSVGEIPLFNFPSSNDEN